MAIRLIVAAFVAALLFQTDSRVEAQSGPYLLRSGDTVRITVREDPALNSTALVTPDGSVAVPIMGNVRAAGRSTEQLRRIVVNGLSSSFAIEPTVTVALVSLGEGPVEELEEPETLAIYVMGEVNRPGRFDVLAEDGVNVLQALTLAGGFSTFAAEKRIQVVRGGVETPDSPAIMFNYDNVIKGLGLEGNVVLANGDVIVVPERNLFE